VRFLGFVPQDTLQAFYESAELFAFPSLYEGFGIPLLEAMACGCPIIASRIPSTVEIADNIPVYHEAGNVEHLLSNLEQVYDEPRETERTIKGLSLAKAYSWDRTARQTAEVYRSLGC
jgi:glycosyltransferase involved in cell wall biosynthesis